MKRPIFLKQKNMLRVLYSLIPVATGAIFFFGWRVLALLAVSFLFAFLTEWYMESKKANGKISYAVFVTAALFGLSLPSTAPFWITAVGIIIAVLFGKMAFGGFGKNVFNPAIVGRAFVYVTFPQEITGSFTPAFKTFPGGFAHWSSGMTAVPAYISQAGLQIADAVTAATPMWARRDFGYTTDLVNMFLGNIGTTFEQAGQTMVLAAGSVGEVSALLIILAGIYLIWTKTANWRLTVSMISGAAVMSFFAHYVLHIPTAAPVPFSLLSGALLYGAVFMVTDPVSAPKVPLSQYIYGAFIGIMVVFFRYQSIFAGGLAFAMLFGNMIAPSLDLWIKRIRARKTVGGKA